MLQHFIRLYGIVDAGIVLRTHPISIERWLNDQHPIPLPVQRWLERWGES